MNATDAASNLLAKHIDWREIGLYLAVCFGITWRVEILALALGLRFATLTVAPKSPARTVLA